jgi:hypothetical protein
LAALREVLPIVEAQFTQVTRKLGGRDGQTFENGATIQVDIRPELSYLPRQKTREMRWQAGVMTGQDAN